MKKFKVIEEGRILTNQELAKVQGGANLCISESTFRVCGEGGKVVCNSFTMEACARNLLTCGGNLKVCEGSKIVCGGDKQIILGVSSGIF